jgi:hypothetical protein
MNNSESYKRECLERWVERAPKRRDLALMVMSGRERIDPKWPAWFAFDIQAEIGLIKEERAKDAAAASEKRRVADAERADKEWLL